MAFSPSNISGLQLWFDASDTSTITGTSQVTLWQNKGLLGSSANASNLTNSCSSGNTLNGLNFIRIPAGAELKFTAALNTQPRSWFIVGKLNTTLNSTYQYAGFVNQTVANGQDSVVMFYSNASTNGVAVGPSGVAIVNMGYFTSSTSYSPFIVTNINSLYTSLNAVTMNGTSLSIDPTTNIAAANYNTSSILYTIGTARYGTSLDVMEILFYSGDVTPTQRQTVEGYLAWKWGLQNNLPANHLYYSSSPVSNTVPTAPTSVTAVAGNSQAIVSFTAPASSGSSAITSYTVTSSPGNITATGAASPITVTGLTNGTAYTFTVTATNSVGLGTASLPSNSITPGNSNNFLEWIKQTRLMNTTTSDTTSSIATDTSGNVYVSYSTGGTISGGTFRGTNDIVVFKMDKLGNMIWIKEHALMNTTSAELSPSITVDSVGNVYLSYQTSGTLSGGTFRGSIDIVVSKMDTNGNMVWIKQLSNMNTSGGDYAPTLGVDVSGNVYVSYYTNSSVSGGTFMGSWDIAVFKLDTNGNLVWVRQQNTLNSVVSDTNPSTFVDLSGNVYLSYNVGGTISGGTFRGSLDIVVVKMDTNGNIVWTRQQATMNTTLQEANAWISGDYSGNVYVSYYTTGTISGGTFAGGSQDIVVLKMDTNGSIVWTRQRTIMNTAGGDLYPKISLDYIGNLYVIYQTTGTVSGGTNMGGANDIVFFKMDSNGNLVWIKQEGIMNTAGDDNTPAISADINGNIYLTYQTTGTVSGGTFLGLWDIVVAKYAPSGSVPGAPTAISAVAGNSQATVSFTAPTNNGSAAITSYIVTSSAGHVATGASSPITITGLTNGTSYTFSVRAANEVGLSNASSSSNTVVPVGPPSAPNNNISGAINFAAYENGARIYNQTNTSYYGPGPYAANDTTPNGYYVPNAMLWNGTAGTNSTTRSTKSTENVSEWDNNSSFGPAGTERFIIVDLGAEYTFNKAYAYQSFTVYGRTTHIGLSYAPAGVSYTATDSRLTYSSNTWVQIFSNEIVSNDNNGSFNMEKSFSSVTTRYVRVTVKNDGRYGLPNWLELYNLKLFADIGVIATAKSLGALVSWTQPANGGSAITSYTITPYQGASPVTAAITTVYGATNTSAYIYGLTNGVAYTFTVTATNAIGTSPASSPSSAITPVSDTITTAVVTGPSSITSYISSASATTTTERADLSISMRVSLNAGTSGSTTQQKVDAKVAYIDSMRAKVGASSFTIPETKFTDFLATLVTRTTDTLTPKPITAYVPQFTAQTATVDVSSASSANYVHFEVPIGYTVVLQNGGASLSLVYNGTNFSDGSNTYNAGAIIVLGTKTFTLVGIGSGILNVQDSSQIVCITKGSMVQTPVGNERIESLGVGDKVVTGDGRIVPITSMKQIVVVAANEQNAPYVIEKDAFGKNSPPNRLEVSPRHAIQLPSGLWEIPREASKDNKRVYQNKAVIGKQVVYYHFALPNYETDTAVVNGQITETLNDGKCVESYGWNEEKKGYVRFIKHVGNDQKLTKKQ